MSENQEEVKKSSTKTLIIVAAVLVVIVLCGFLVFGGDSGPVEYEVTHRTGLYEEVTDEEPWRHLSVGTTLKPTGDPDTLQCKTVTVEGVSMELCHFQVKGSSDYGWVLKKWTRAR